MKAKRCPFAPDAIRASRMLDGPIRGFTSKPSACASATSSAPGSATAGQPASLNSPISRPSRRGCSSEGMSALGVCSLSGRRFSSRMGRVMPMCFRQARAVFSASTAKSARWVICACSCGSRAGMSGVPSGAGMRYKAGMGFFFVCWVPRAA